jgi:ABC-2 type transport system permease protein
VAWLSALSETVSNAFPNNSAEAGNFTTALFHIPGIIFGFTIALLISTWSILSIGFLIASIVPTARFAQPIGAAILYPMIGVCGLFVPLQSLPPAMQAVARVLPLTYAVSLLQGIWKGEAWSAHLGDAAALVVVFVICTALSAKVFRWE